MPARSAICLDSNAGAPLLHEVRQALLPFFDAQNPVFLANPSSVHSFGRASRSALTEARDAVASSLGKSVSGSSIQFTSSGTEANQAAIRAELEPKLLAKEPVHWITTRLEHDCVDQMVAWFEARGGKVDFLPHDAQGRARVDALPGLLRPETALVSAIWVNNETGVIADVDALAKTCRGAGVPLHLDGAQAWGKLPLDLASLGADYVAFSGHKVGALPGSGFLYSRRPIRAQARTFPGKQERDQRGGTENLVGIVALGAAARTLDPVAYALEVRPVRERLERAILERMPGFALNGGDAPRVANTVSLSWTGPAPFPQNLVMALDLAGFAVSAGSACASGSPEPSRVLLALGRAPDQAQASLRLSLRRGQSWEQVAPFVDALERAVSRGREFA